MVRPVPTALLCAAVFAWTAAARVVMFGDGAHDPTQRLEPLPEPVFGPPWLFPGNTKTATTTTTLTISMPGSTSLPSLTSSGPLGTTTPAPGGGSPQSPSSGALVTATMPTATTASSGLQTTTTDISNAAGSSSDGDGGVTSNRTLVITLSTVLSAVGLALLVGTILLCWRARRRRLPFLARGVSPIDDDEIERWKGAGRRGEKAGFHGGDTDVEADAVLHKETAAPSHAKHSSTSSVKKPPSVIVYSSPRQSQGGARHSTDAESRRSFTQNHPSVHVYGGKSSFDKALPQTPIQARAPNARAGLTDESVPGDEPFLPGPKRTPSRLSKIPPNSAMGRRAHHARARSSRSSTRSFGDSYYPYGAGSELELSPRHSHDHVVPARHSSGSRSRSYGGGPRSSHSRVYSSSSIPPRLSFGDEMLLGGLSPARPRFNGDGEIGRAIG